MKALAAAIAMASSTCGVSPLTPANFAWGDADGRTLYLTARTGLYRLRLGIPGIRP